MNIEIDSPTERILGLHWDTSSDEFLFKIKFPDLNQPLNQTKRQVLKNLMSVFDPLGLLAHVMIRGKVIMQDIWMRKTIEWDTPIPNDLSSKWLNWVEELKGISRLRIPRNYSPFLLSTNDVELHIFTDASERAFAAVGYVKIKSKDCHHVALISGKTKIASQKSSKILSIPRLELQGAILGCRLTQFIQQEHSISFSSITYWCDSKTVLSWIRAENKVFKQFVSHRISEILSTTEVKQWRYIPSSENPADDATKVGKDDPFCFNNRWFQGPSFIRESEESWPIEKNNVNVSENDLEIRKVFLIHDMPDRIKRLDYSPIDPTKFSDWYDLTRKTAWIKRCISNWNNRVQSRITNHKSLSLIEMRNAEEYHIKKSQLQSFPEEIKLLRKNIAVSDKSKIADLVPFLDDRGQMRMAGRIGESPYVPENMKYPLILNRHHPITKLIVKEYHERHEHHFQEAVVNEIRTKYWIPQLRLAVKYAKKHCQKCKNDSASPIPPQMANLPLARVDAFIGCFQYCGVDLFGPLLVPVKRSLEKRWGVIYTCMTTRGIYLDLVPDLSADSLILSLRKCHARRGPIKHIYSDCGTNLKGARSDLQEALDTIKEAALHRECVKHQIEWHYNPPASPHMGGCWERMVRTVKGVLYKMLKEKHPKEHVLRSLLCEIEDIVNSRPLTYIALERDTEDALTPKHFMNPYHRHTPPPPGEFDTTDLTGRKQWRFVQEMANHFWKRFVAEYLPMITRRTKWYAKSSPLQTGDVVVICDHTAPRNQWEKGIIVAVKISGDGQVRSATVRTKHGILTRPAVKLARLDIIAEVNPPEFTEGGVNNVGNTVDVGVSSKSECQSKSVS